MRLFGEEEIQQDLFIAVCEWPTDDTRIVIHGYWLVYDSVFRITVISCDLGVEEIVKEVM